MTKSRPVLITMSVLAGLQVLTAGAALTDTIGKDAAAFLVLAVAAVQAGVQFYVQAQVVPLADVSAYLDKHGEQVSGPAAPPAGEPVDVEPAAADVPLGHPAYPDIDDPRL